MLYRSVWGFGSIASRSSSRSISIVSPDGIELKFVLIIAVAIDTLHFSENKFEILVWSLCSTGFEAVVYFLCLLLWDTLLLSFRLVPPAFLVLLLCPVHLSNPDLSWCFEFLVRERGSSPVMNTLRNWQWLKLQLLRRMFLAKCVHFRLDTWHLRSQPFITLDT